MRNGVERVRSSSDRLLAFGIHGSGHAADDLPLAVRTNPRVRDSKCVGPYFGSFVIGPGGLDTIMVDRNVAGYMNGKLLDRVGLQLHAFRCVRRDPISDVIFPDGR